MKEFGEYLRNERLSRGVTLEEIERKTRIRRQHLLSIENGEFQRLPEPAYVRAFLRHYAECVGLDPKAVVERYEGLQSSEEARTNDRGDANGRSQRRIQQFRARRRRRAVQWVLVVGTLLLVIGYLQWPRIVTMFGSTTSEVSAVSGGDLSPEDSAGAPQDGIGGAEPTAEALGSSAVISKERQVARPPDATPSNGLNTQDGPVVEATTAESGIDADSLRVAVLSPGGDVVTVPPDQRGDRFVLGLSVRDISWAELWVDGERVLYRNLEADESFAFEVERSASLRLGRAENVDLSLNGIAVGPLGTSIVSRSFVLQGL